jgi:predicted nucleic acid-binding protein
VSIFLDTNILLYSISDAPEEQVKRTIALSLLDRHDIVLSVQVLQEFHNQATRLTRSASRPNDAVERIVTSWLRFTVQENTVALFLQALSIVRSHRISIWDALIVAAAQTSGCDTLMTEDLSHGQKFGPVRVENPFS